MGHLEFEAKLEEVAKTSVTLQQVFEYLKNNLSVRLRKEAEYDSWEVTGFNWQADVYLKNPETGEVVCLN